MTLIAKDERAAASWKGVFRSERRVGNRLEGGVVNASRSVNFPAEADGAASLADWRTAVAAAIEAAQADLKSLSGQAETASASP